MVEVPLWLIIVLAIIFIWLICRVGALMRDRKTLRNMIRRLEGADDERPEHEEFSGDAEGMS